MWLVYTTASKKENVVTDTREYCNISLRCTSTANDCVRQAKGANILPPIVSGRMTTKSFAFTYGTIHIRAKLPQGDWLYPGRRFLILIYITEVTYSMFWCHL